MSFSPVKLGSGMKILPDGTIDIDATKLPSVSVAPATATDPGLVKVPAGSGLSVGPNGTLGIDSKTPSPLSGTLAMSEAFITAATGDSWTMQQISDRLAQSLASVFAPAGSGSASPTTPPAQTITIAAIVGQVVGKPFTVSGSYANGALSSLEYSDDGEATWKPASASISNGGYSFSVTLSVARANQVISVRNSANTAIKAASAAFAVTAAAVYTITVNTPQAQVEGVAFTVTGSYANGGPPTDLAYALSGSDSGPWTQLQGETIKSDGTYSFSLTIPAANASQVLKVRDNVNNSVIGTSGSFVVAAAAATQPTTQSAYTFTKRSQDKTAITVAGDGSYVDGGNVSIYAVNAAGNAPDSLKATYSNSATTPPPVGNFTDMFAQNLYEAGAPSPVAFAFTAYFNTRGTYYYWVQDQNGVIVQLRQLDPIVVS